MKLTVTGRYRNGPTSYEAGQVIDVTDEIGGFLMRDSPGTFELADVVTETASGIKAVDRRARGGQRR